MMGVFNPRHPSMHCPRSRRWHLDAVLGLVSLALVLVMSIDFGLHGYGGRGAGESWQLKFGVWVFFLMLATAVCAVWLGIRQRRVPWLAFGCLVMALAVEWPDWRSPRLWVRDVFKYEVPSSWGLVRDARGRAEKHVIFTISAADWVVLREQGIGGDKEWRCMDSDSFIGPMIGSDSLMVLELERHRYVGCDPDLLRLTFVSF